jgi:UDP-N-acetylglucosamine:LPS N-acetylglucosamine transferase
LMKWKPHVVLGTGGYVSGPVLVAAKLLRLPCVIQEQNCIPGMTNRLLCRWVEQVHISFAESRKYFPRKDNLLLSGNPIRGSLLRGSKAAGLRKFRLAEGAFTVAAVRVPYPHAAHGHQEANARAMEDKGAARVILDAELSGPRLAEIISELARSKRKLKEMSINARQYARPDAGERIAKAIEELAAAKASKAHASARRRRPPEGRGKPSYPGGGRQGASAR